jgi:hypothetical protein
MGFMRNGRAAGQCSHDRLAIADANLARWLSRGFPERCAEALSSRGRRHPIYAQND